MYNLHITLRKIVPCLAICILSVTIFKMRHDDCLVKTKVGYIKGVQANNGDYTMYMGVPYAKVNESNPFGNALPVTHLEDVFYANEDTKICPQIDNFNETTVGNLDCLNLNIYVPNSASVSNLLPVLVFIHGGRFETGATGRYLYGPTFLMKQNVIVITINYRLGPYGCLCLDTPEIPSNQGFKDQILAMNWIKNNIDAFGGDHNKMTLAGESTGGQNVYLHLMFAKQPLFNNVIIGAGIFPDDLTLVPSDKTIPLKLAADLGLKTKDTKEALSFLASLETNLVIATSKKLNIFFGPCIEEEIDSVERFITNHTRFVDPRNVKDIPIMLTQSNNEMAYYLANNNLDKGEHENIFKEILAPIFDIEEDKLDSLVEQVRHFYIGDKKVDNTVKQPVTDFLSDIFFNYPTRKISTYFVNNGAKKTYHSIFSYAGDRNYIKHLNHMDRNTEGASHADEIGYLFDGNFMNEPITPDDQLMINRFTTLWGNFVKYGNPTPERTELLPVIWQPVTEKSLLYLNIDLDLRMRMDPFNDRMVFWEQLYKQNNLTEKFGTIPWSLCPIRR